MLHKEVTKKQYSVKDVFKDFNERRVAMIKALTDDVDEFFQRCDPEKENLCLYAYPDGTWDVNIPTEEIPTELPEPVMGINFARDGTEFKEWLLLVAAHSDSWLIAVAFYFGAHFDFDKKKRQKLFARLNDMPTVYEVVNASYATQEKTAKKRNPHKAGTSKVVKKPKVEREESDEGGEDWALCDACGGHSANDSPRGEFWICCDICDKWNHGKCVNVNANKAKKIEKYKCFNCRKNERED